MHYLVIFIFRYPLAHVGQQIVGMYNNELCFLNSFYLVKERKGRNIVFI